MLKSMPDCMSMRPSWPPPRMPIFLFTVAMV
jgi:hypothetical protein